MSFPSDEFIIYEGKKAYSPSRNRNPKSPCLGNTIIQLIIVVFAYPSTLHWALQQHWPSSHYWEGFCVVLAGKPQISNYMSWEANAMIR